MRRGFRTYLPFMLFLLSICTCTPLFSQSATLSVTVLDDAESSLLDGASVIIEGPSPQNGTAQNGKIKFTGLADGSYKITASCPGYEANSGKIIVSSADKTEYTGLFRVKRTGAVPVKKEFKAESKPREKPAATEKKPEQVEKPREPVKTATPPVQTKPEVKKDQEPVKSEEPPVLAERKPLFDGLHAPSWKSLLGAVAVFSGLIAFFSLILLAMRWKKSGRTGKIILSIGTFGCGCLTLIIIVILAVAVLLYARKASTEKGESSKASPEQAKYPEYKELAVKADVLSKSAHDAGAALLIESFNEPGKADKKEKAFALLAQAAEENPGNDAYAVDLADAYVLCSDQYAIRVAADIYEDVLTRRPNDEAILARAADAYIQLDEFEKANAFIKRRIALPKSDLYGAALQTSLICVETGDFNSGIDRLSQIVSKHPERDDVKMLLAAMQIQNGLPEMAKLTLDEAISKLPKGSPLLAQATKMRRSLEK
ncbi:MAG TPA: hypothetical protein DET40_18400 [Lentisphaeria bacterium]|nr:MAG: hypothetical protein A2X45_14540 [Lentisphaerae bacterium GWF2_50_93]HCE45515.1 hypothetical protein [Lentisphaeria bacterium]